MQVGVPIDFSLAAGCCVPRKFRSMVMDEKISWRWQATIIANELLTYWQWQKVNHWINIVRMTLGGLEDELSNVILSGLVSSSCGDWSLAQTKVVTCRFGRSNILGALEPQNCSSFIIKDISCIKLASDLRTAAIISTSVTPHTDEQTDTTKFVCVVFTFSKTKAGRRIV